jgi:ATP-dependent 26S proteasome regulatory subunit
MPPPSYLKGTLQFSQAFERGEIQLSIEQLPTITMLADQHEQTTLDYHYEQHESLQGEQNYSSPAADLMDQSQQYSESTQDEEQPDISLSATNLSPSLRMEGSTCQAPPFCISQTQDDQMQVLEDVYSENGEVNVQVQARVLTAPPSHASFSSRKRKVSSIGDSSTMLIEKTRFKDIIGHTAVKVRCDELLLPMLLPPTLTDSVLTGIRSMPASILLFGPPGCGKTKMARALAGEAQAAFLPIAPSDVYSKFVGVSLLQLRQGESTDSFHAR